MYSVHVDHVSKLPSIREKSGFFRNLDPEVDYMINLPEDPQSDLEFIAVRSHACCDYQCCPHYWLCFQHVTPSLSQVVLLLMSVHTAVEQSVLCVILTTIST